MPCEVLLRILSGAGSASRTGTVFLSRAGTAFLSRVPDGFFSLLLKRVEPSSRPKSSSSSCSAGSITLFSMSAASARFCASFCLSSLLSRSCSRSFSRSSLSLSFSCRISSRRLWDSARACCAFILLFSIKDGSPLSILLSCAFLYRATGENWVATSRQIRMSRIRIKTDPTFLNRLNRPYARLPPRSPPPSLAAAQRW